MEYCVNSKNCLKIIIPKDNSKQVNTILCSVKRNYIVGPFKTFQEIYEEKQGVFKPKDFQQSTFSANLRPSQFINKEIRLKVKPNFFTMCDIEESDIDFVYQWYQMSANDKKIKFWDQDA